MADREIPADHWIGLRKSALAFIPKLVRAAASPAFTARDLHEAGRLAGVLEFSQHFAGKVINLNPVTNENGEKTLKAYAKLREKRNDLPELTGKDIVCAFFVLPEFKRIKNELEIKKVILPDFSGVSTTAIDYALEGGRVSYGIARAIHVVLAKEAKKVGLTIPTLDEFAISNPDKELGAKTIKGRPFTLNDLLLPIE